MSTLKFHKYLPRIALLRPVAHPAITVYRPLIQLELRLLPTRPWYSPSSPGLQRLPVLSGLWPFFPRSFLEPSSSPLRVDVPSGPALGS